MTGRQLSGFYFVRRAMNYLPGETEAYRYNTTSGDGTAHPINSEESISRWDAGKYTKTQSHPYILSKSVLCMLTGWKNMHDLA